MNGIQSLDYIPNFLSEITFSEEAKEVIKEIALSSLKELVISLAFAGITCLFVVTPIGMVTAIGGALLVVILNTFYKSLGGYCDLRLDEIQGIQDAEIAKERAFLEKARSFLKFACAYDFGTFYTGTAGVVVHESGHALTGLALTKGPIHVTVDPFMGGATEGQFKNLSSLGKLLGVNESEMALCGAGAAFTLIFSIGFIIAAHFLSESNPELSAYLNAMGLAGILTEVTYALSALFVTSLSEAAGHDFVALWAGGLHPIIPVVIMILVPLLVKGTLYVVDELRQNPSMI